MAWCAQLGQVLVTVSQATLRSLPVIGGRVLTARRRSGLGHVNSSRFNASHE